MTTSHTVQWPELNTQTMARKLTSLPVYAITLKLVSTMTNPALFGALEREGDILVPT